MLTKRNTGSLFPLVIVLVLQGAIIAVASARTAKTTANMFSNPSFEMGRASWRMDKAAKTVAAFTVDRGDSAAGEHSALVTVESVEEWGAQFGQSVQAGQKGKTYTFAVLAKSTRGPVVVDLQIERRAKPHDRAARSRKFTLRKDQWTELHVTFKVKADFPQGWFAYISCTQGGCQFRADMFRLYEGEYIPYKQLASRHAASSGVCLFDTGTSSPAPLSGAALAKRDGWARLPEDQVAHRFKGDTVLSNSRLAVAFRRKSRGAEVYSLGSAGPTLRALLTPVGEGGKVESVSTKVVRSGPNGAAVDAVHSLADGKALALRYELRIGQVYVKTEPRQAVTGLRVEAPCRFAVLPDFFADDIVIDAAQLPVRRADLPSENFLLHLLGDGEAIVMNVWSSRDEDIRMTLSGLGTTKKITGSEIRYGKEGKIWTAVLDEPGIWHVHNVASRDIGRIMPLDWRAPYPAQWRVDWRRRDRLVDSWEMLVERPGGRYMKPGWFGSPGTVPANRRRWTTVLGRFEYPCWIDRNGRGYLQPLKKVLHFEGPAVIYPINRVQDTPLDRFTVVDIVRSTLGVGPCEFILDVEGQRSRYVGRATCSARDALNPIYARGRQRQQRARIEKVLKEVMAFIRHIRGRIENYVAFGHELLDYLAEQRKAHPELTKHLAELETLTRAIDARVADRKGTIKTPAYAAKMVEEFRRTMLDYEGADALTKCKKFTKALVEIGGSQDELVGETRWAVKVVRQRAGILMAIEPRMAEVAREIRRRSQKVLRNPTGHEAARH